MKKIVVTGANGYLASFIQSHNKERFEFIPVTRKEVDLENTEQVNTYFSTLEFDAVLHTAARAQTLDCETNPIDTHKVNVESAIALANICKQKGARFIFLSTEQVFNNKQIAAPFHETDTVNSTTVYGNHKIEVEEYLLAQQIDTVILRLSWMMGLSYPGVHAGPNIIKNVLDSLLYNRPTYFTVNETRGLTYAKNLATHFEVLTTLPAGIYHFSSTNEKNTYEAAKYIAQTLGFDTKTIDQIILPDTKRYADHHRNLRLATEKLEHHGIPMATFEEDVRACLNDFGYQ
ncbi:MAG: SDR family oxidoreductase [Enterococcus sp.]